MPAQSLARVGVGQCACLLVSLGLSSSTGALGASARPDNPVVPFPHPLISEILAAVPSGPQGDASGDGTRQAIGDEFIELFNPHDKPIQLKGYTLVDAGGYQPGAPKPARPGAGAGAGTGTGSGSGSGHASPPNKPGGKPGDPSQTGKPGPDGGSEAPPARDAERAGGLSFTFPDLTLAPGQVVVVFNGYKSTFDQAVGDAKASAGPNPRFHGAFVFTMRNESPYGALGNEGDFVLLRDPAGKPVECVKWGRVDKNPPADCPLIEEAPLAQGSVQRATPTGKFEVHRELKGDLKGAVFSPGLLPWAKPATSGAKPPNSAGAPPAAPAAPGPGRNGG